MHRCTCTHGFNCVATESRLRAQISAGPSHPMLLQCLSGGGGGPSPPSKGAGGVPVYTCELCGQSMTHAYSMQRHRKQHMTEPKSFACEVCGRRYNRRDNLLVHVRTHFAA
ncbi:hypothetical protein ISCGN_032320 [Ixodes scapularis]